MSHFNIPPFAQHRAIRKMKRYLIVLECSFFEPHSSVDSNITCLPFAICTAALQASTADWAVLQGSRQAVKKVYRIQSDVMSLISEADSGPLPHYPPGSSKTLGTGRLEQRAHSSCLLSVVWYSQMIRCIKLHKKNYSKRRPTLSVLQ